jgi:hypothetical protein
MALRWIEGFETFGAVGRNGQALIDDLMVKYPSSSGLVTSGALIAGRNGGVAYDIYNINATLAVKLDFQPTWVIGFAFLCGALGSPFTMVKLARDTVGYTQCDLRLNASRRLEVYSNSAIRATGTTVLDIGRWYYIEWKVTIADSGSTEVRINGVTDITVTGIDTKQSSSADANLIAFYSAAGDGYDDIYILDGTGTTTDFLGEVAITGLFPSADSGVMDWYPSEGTEHCALIDDNPGDGDTTYLSADTGGQQDLFDYSDLGSIPGDILGIQVNTRYRTESPAHTLVPVVQSVETYDQPSVVVTNTSYLETGVVLEQDPHIGAPWTESALSAAQFGFRMTS